MNHEKRAKKNNYTGKKYNLANLESEELNCKECGEREIKDALPRSPLGKVLEYAKNHLPGLKMYY